MTEWLISCPAWGNRCVTALIKAALPSMRAALSYAGARAFFLVQTDQRALLAPLFTSGEVEFRPVPPAKSVHDALGESNRQAITLASGGQPIAFVNADMLVSRETFAACTVRFATGKRVIIGAATRTLGGAPLIDARSGDLLAWSMQHRHPTIAQLFWGEGKSSVPWSIYFKRGDNIVLRGFHLHPLACIKDRTIAFKGTTTDFDLAAAYTRDETHVVRDANELAMAECSPPDRVFALRSAPSTILSVAEWAARNTIDVHRWFFRENPIVIKGEDDCGDKDIAEKIINELISLENARGVQVPRQYAAR